MSRGFDGFEIDDFRGTDFGSDREVSRSPSSDWNKWTELHNIHREEERADRLDREAPDRSNRDRPPLAREERVQTILSQRVHTRYTDARHGAGRDLSEPGQEPLHGREHQHSLLPLASQSAAKGLSG